MKKFLKFFSIVITITLLASALCGCSGTKDVHTGGKFTYWSTMSSTASQTLTSYNDLMMYQEMANATGTNVEFIHSASGSTGTEAFQILLASGDYPDMIEYNWTSYAGGPEQAISDGVIISLNDYLEEYAPNFYDYMEGEKGKENEYRYKLQSITPSGNYYGFNSLNVGSYKTTAGLYIRKDLLDDWNLDIPQTIDDWDIVFETAKENGVKYPLTGEASIFSITGMASFSPAWNVGKGWYVDNGNIKFGPFEKAYKDYIEKMAEWTKAGYIDVDFITNDYATVEGYMTNGTSIAMFGNIGSGIGKLLPAMAERDPEYDLAACPYPVMKEGDVQSFQWIVGEAADPAIAISVQCGIENEDRYKEAIKWCDYHYSEEGTILKCFGVEGDTFTIEKDENGVEHYVYTDKIMDHEAIGAHSISASLFHFLRPANSPGLNQHDDYLNGFYPYQQQKDALVVWNKNIDSAKEHAVPPLSYTSDESTKKANIEASGTNNLDAAILNIILGKDSLDTYDDAIKQAKKAGYDELIKIMQTAYDRYISILD